MLGGYSGRKVFENGERREGSKRLPLLTRGLSWYHTVVMVSYSACDGTSTATWSTRSRRSAQKQGFEKHT